MSYSYCRKMLPSSEGYAAVNADTDFTATAYKVETGANKRATLYLYSRGEDANCLSNLTFVFQRSPDYDNWHDFVRRGLTADGTSVVSNDNTTFDIDLEHTRYIRLARVENNERTAGRGSAVQAYLQFHKP